MNVVIDMLFLFSAVIYSFRFLGKAFFQIAFQKHTNALKEALKSPTLWQTFRNYLIHVYTNLTQNILTG